MATHVHDFSTAVPLGDAAALAARMDLCLGVDTGLVHLASSVGVPAVVLVGPTDPESLVALADGFDRAAVVPGVAARSPNGS